MRKAALLRLLLRVHQITHRPTLHENDRMMPILPRGRGGETVDIFGAGGFQHLLKAESSHMMALVADHAAVFDHLPQHVRHIKQAAGDAHIVDDVVLRNLLPGERVYSFGQLVQIILRVLHDL